MSSTNDITATQRSSKNSTSNAHHTNSQNSPASLLDVSTIPSLPTRSPPPPQPLPQQPNLSLPITLAVPPTLPTSESTQHLPAVVAANESLAPPADDASLPRLPGPNGEIVDCKNTLQSHSIVANRVTDSSSTVVLHSAMDDDNVAASSLTDDMPVSSGDAFYKHVQGVQPSRQAAQPEPNGGAGANGSATLDLSGVVVSDLEKDDSAFDVVDSPVASLLSRLEHGQQPQAMVAALAVYDPNGQPLAHPPLPVQAAHGVTAEDVAKESPRSIDSSIASDSRNKQAEEPRDELAAKRWSLRSIGKIAVVALTVLMVSTVGIVCGNGLCRARHSRIPIDGVVGELSQVVEYLLTKNVSSALLLSDDATPQYQAARWLAELDAANLSLPLDAATLLGDNSNYPMIEERKSEDYHYKYIVRYVLALNWFALGGPEHWTHSLNFLSHRDVCFWRRQAPVDTGFQVVGVYCENDAGSPTDLIIGQAAPRGPIPTENGLLTSLLRFDIQSSLIEGTIPTELCHLTSLQRFIVSQNDLTGSIPSCFGQLTNMTMLYVNQNSLSGSLPNELSSMANLEHLVIEQNQFTGDPTILWSELHNLKWLYAGTNNFTGLLDGNFMALAGSLEVMDLSHNEFSLADNALPAHFFTLRSLRSLDLSNCPLNGNIPSNPMGDLRNKALTFLSLRKTKMYDTLPHFLDRNLLALEHLDLSDNGFLGTMPTEYGRIATLKSLLLSDNEDLTPGTVPSEYTNLVNLNELSLRNTMRNGSLPALAPNIIIVDFGSNQFNSTIPESYGRHADMKYLILYNNSGISGSIPYSLLSLTLQGAFLDGTSLEDGTMDIMCQAQPSEVLVGDCITCPCAGCFCCRPGLVGGCSKPYLDNLDSNLSRSHDALEFS